MTEEVSTRAKGIRRCSEHNIEGSMNKAVCPYDNSCIESFFVKSEKGILLPVGVCYNKRNEEEFAYLHRVLL